MAEENKDKAALDAERAKLEEDKRVFAFAQALGVASLSLEKQVVDGVMTPAIRDKIKASWDGKRATFKAGDSLDIPSDMLGEIVKLAAAMPKGEQAKDGKSGDPKEVKEEPGDILAREATALMFSQKLTYEQAVQSIRATKPEMYKAYLGSTQKEVASFFNGTMQFVPVGEVSNG